MALAFAAAIHTAGKAAPDCRAITSYLIGSNGTLLVYNITFGHTDGAAPALSGIFLDPAAP